MGFGDFVTSMKNKAVEGFNAVADAVTESAPVKMATEALTTAKDIAVSTKDALVSTATNIFTKDVLPTATTITTAVGAYVPDSLKMAAKTVVQNIDVLAVAAINPIAGLGYATYKSMDGSFSLTQVEGKGLAAGTGNSGDAVYAALHAYEAKNGGTTSTVPTDKPATTPANPIDADGCLVFSSPYPNGEGGSCQAPKETVKLTQNEWDILNGKADAPVQRTSGTDANATDQVKDHTYIDEEGRTVEVKVVDGKVTVLRKNKDGTTSDITAEKGKTVANHNGETATVEGGVSTVESPQGTWGKDAQGTFLTKDGKVYRGSESGTLKVFDQATGRLLREMTREGVTEHLENNTILHILEPTTAIQDAARKMEDEVDKGPADALSMMVAKDMTIAITKRLRVEKLNDGNVIFRTRKNGDDDKVFLLTSAGKLLVMVDGQFVEADDAAKEAWVKFTKQLEDMDQSNIDEATGNVTIKGIQMFASGNLVVKAADGTTQAEVNRDNPNAPKVTTANGTTTVDADKLAIEDPALGHTTWDGKTLVTPEFKMTPETIENTVTGTKIDEQGTITMDHGKGPTLRADGSADFDRQTHIDANGNVTSGNWHASAHFEASVSGSSGAGFTLEKAQSQIQAATKNADSIYGKVLSRTVRMSDIADLDNAFTSISGLLSAAAGNPIFAAQLISALGRISEVRSAAVAPAYAAQLAESKGIPESQIPSVQGRLLTDTAEHAVAITLSKAA